MISRLMMGMALLVMLGGCGSGQNQTGDSGGSGSRIPSRTDVALNNQSQIDEGIRQLQSSNVAGAIQNFDAAIKENPRDPLGYLVLGQTYLRLKEYDRAIDTFSAATRVAPQEGEAYYLLAVSYGLTGNNDLARENAERSITIFQGQQDQEKFVRSVALLKGLSESE